MDTNRELVREMEMLALEFNVLNIGEVEEDYREATLEEMVEGLIEINQELISAYRDLA